MEGKHTAVRIEERCSGCGIPLQKGAPRYRNCESSKAKCMGCSGIFDEFEVTMLERLFDGEVN
jgi:hypothetical protein